jgi:hypothetical protein
MEFNQGTKKAMKRLFLIISMVAAAILVFSLTQAYASSDPDGNGKKRPPDSEVTPTPDRQATAKAKQQTNPGSVQQTAKANQQTNPGVTQPTLNAIRWATAHPEQAKPETAGGNTFVGKPKNFKGEIVSVDTTSLVIAQSEGVLLAFNFTDETIIKIPGPNTEPSDLASGLQVGMDVSVKGILAIDGSITATRITAIPGQPEMISHVGKVNLFIKGVSITIENKKGEYFTYALDEETKYLPVERLPELKSGVVVTVIFSRDVSGKPAIASGVVIHPEGTLLPDE